MSLSGNRVGDIATYECDFGFRLEGDEERSCDVSGEWEGEAATCVRKFRFHAGISGSFFFFSANMIVNNYKGSANNNNVLASIIIIKPIPTFFMFPVAHVPNK